eukprot:673691-Pyramimonas_sp.AAC.1
MLDDEKVKLEARLGDAKVELEDKEGPPKREDNNKLEVKPGPEEKRGRLCKPATTRQRDASQASAPSPDSALGRLASRWELRAWLFRADCEG